MGRGVAVGGGGRRRSGEVIALPVPVVGLTVPRPSPSDSARIRPRTSKTCADLASPAGFETIGSLRRDLQVHLTPDAGGPRSNPPTGRPGRCSATTSTSSTSPAQWRTGTTAQPPGGPRTSALASRINPPPPDESVEVMAIGRPLMLSSRKRWIDATPEAASWPPSRSRGNSRPYCLENHLITQYS